MKGGIDEKLTKYPYLNYSLHIKIFRITMGISNKTNKNEILKRH